jgi:hypothetical protein
LRTLAGDASPGVDTGRIADWLLGQQPEAEAERTRGAVARNAAARSWAESAAERLRELGGAAVPDVPAAEEAPAARPRPLREDAPPPASSPRSSRLGGAILIAVLVLIVGGLIAFVATRGDDEPSGSAAAETPATPTPTASAQGDITGNDILLQGASGSNAAGLMRLIPANDGKVRFAIAAENVPPNTNRDSYAVWFTKPGSKPRRLGFSKVPVGDNGVLTTGGPQKGDEDEFPRWFATYEKVLVTRETRKTSQPGEIVLQGTLPAGAG